MQTVNIISVLLIIAIIAIVIWYLITLNKKLSQKIEQEKNRFILYEKQLKELDRPDLNNKDIETINKLARDFFKERFNMNYSLTYLELANKFKEEKYDERVDFCNLMSDLMYSDQKIDSKDIKKLVTLLMDIVNDYK